MSDFSGSEKYEGFDIHVNILLRPTDADAHKQAATRSDVGAQYFR